MFKLCARRKARTTALGAPIFKIPAKFNSRRKQQLPCRNVFAAVFFITALVFSAAPAYCKNKYQDVVKRRPLANSAYRDVSPEKSLAVSPQFILIDDFNSPEWKNGRGGIWHLRKATGKQIQITRPRQDARNPKFGSSLQLQFDLPKNKEMIFLSSLDKLDVSQADALVFSCKFSFDVAEGFSGSLRLVVEDWRAKKGVMDITAGCSGDRAWNEITFNRKAFPGLDWDQLNTLSFVLVSGMQNAVGKLQVDEIAFYGERDVFFESHRDNLKNFPQTVLLEDRREILKRIKKDDVLLREIAADTWKYFDAAQNSEHHLIVDHIRMGEAPLASDYTSPTNMALDLMSVVAAEKMQLITRADAMERISEKLRIIEKMRRWRGLYYNFYETTKLSVTRGFISSIDNGWLGIALVVVRQAMGQEFYREATKILNRMDFSEFLDYENNQLSLGFDSEKNELVNTHYGMLVSEARATSLLGIGKGDLPESHWWSLYRTPPTVWVWQNQKAKGYETEQGGTAYFQGYYQYGDLKIVPSWGGSLFEHLMPTLVLDEKILATDSFGANNMNAILVHKDYAQKQGYALWGLSPAATVNGRTWKYEEYGIKSIAVKGYADKAVVTPHVSFLALSATPVEAILNIRKMLEYKIYGEYGFYDSIQMKTGAVNTQYLALDQGMIFLAIANYLEEGYIQKLFLKDPIGQKAVAILAKEKFFEKKA